MIENPFDLGAGEVGVDQQTGVLPDVLLMARRLEFLTDLRGTAALPDNGVVNRAPGVLFPEDGGLPLVGDADAGDLIRGEVALRHHFRQYPGLGSIDLQGVLLHIAGTGIDLGQFLLSRGNDVSLVIEYHGPGTGCALIQSDNILLHVLAPC